MCSQIKPLDCEPTLATYASVIQNFFCFLTWFIHRRQMKFLYNLGTDFM